MKKLLVIGLFLFVLIKISAQSFNFKNYTVDDGLPFIQIYAIYQDDKGYLWMGGYGGLSQFNGQKFINYSPRKGLVNYWVTTICEDRNKNLIIGTLDGLSVLNGKSFTNYTSKNGLPNNHVYSVASKENETAIATSLGLCYLNNGKIRVDKRFKNEELIFLKNSLKHYVACTKNKIYYFNQDELETLCEFSAKSDTIITSFETDKNSTLWIGTNHGLLSLSDYDIQHKKKTPSHTTINQNITCLYADYKNILWIGTINSLIKYENKSASTYQLSKEENSNNIICITADYEKNIWIGTHSGLFKFRDEGFTCFGIEDGLKNSFIQTIVCDKKNNLWFGTSGGGVYKYNNLTFTNYTTQNNLANNYASALAVDSLNRIWIGTNSGISYIENNKIFTVDFLQNEFVHFLYIDAKNNLWVGLKTKIACIQNIYSISKKITFYDLPFHEITEGIQLSSMCEDEKGNIYIASFLGGLFLFDGQKISDFTNALHIQTRAVLDVKINAGILYTATLDGIYITQLYNKTTEKISEEDGLSSNLVYSILITGAGQTLWAGTNQGGNKIDLQSFFQSHVKNILSFGKTEGFNGLECNTGGLYQDKTGNIWFGTVNGLVKYSPTKFIHNENEAKLSFTNFKLFYDDTLLPQNAELANKTNNIRFDYMGICLTNPDKVLYIHKLEGFEKSWSPPTNQNNVTYSNLPPGKYTFKIRCCNNQGVWSTEPLTFAFSIKFPFWQHWWFAILVLAFVLLTILLIFRIRLNQIRKEQERESKMQIEIAKNELKALRAQMNPHFLFNSLNSIQHFILTKKTDEAAFYLNRFAKLMRMILNNSEKSTITLQEEISALQLYIELEKMRFNNSFNYEIHLEKNIDADYEQIPAMLLQPYVENAILHGLTPKNAHGLLKINFFIKHSYMHIIIEDNGIGRKKAEELKNQLRISHASMGMKITTERLKLLSNVQQANYKVSVVDLYDEQKKPCGTRVEISWQL